MDAERTESLRIELELRSELSAENATFVEERLRALSSQVTLDKRVSAMWIGEIEGIGIDIRVRLASGGHCEIVAKRGAHHSHDRVEESQHLSPDQFEGSVRTLSLLPLPMKLTSRHNTRFALPNGIEVVLVRAGDIAYVEVELMSTPETLDSDREKLLSLCESIGVIEFLDKGSFDNLCARLSRDVDIVIDTPDSRGPAVVEKLRFLLNSINPAT